MIPGAPHEEGTQRATPNCLEASFKSNIANQPILATPSAS
jgi:hypothetical protein